MRRMYDSVTPTNILNHDATPEMVAGYANGRYAWTQEEWDLFPNALKVRIAVRANYYDAHVLDCEEGDATPAQCPAWARQRRLMGEVPIIYCNRSTRPLVTAAFDNEETEHPLFWIATASGKETIPDGAIGAQFLLDWQGVDVSVMADFIPGIDELPFTPSMKEREEFDMRGYATTTEKMLPIPCDGARQLFILTGGKGTVDGHVYFIGDTQGTGGHYTGDRNIHIDPDRPGPIPIPENTRGITFFHTATADFVAWCA